jgi:hypothetical protein
MTTRIKIDRDVVENEINLSLDIDPLDGFIVEEATWITTGKPLNESEMDELYEYLKRNISLEDSETWPF